ncbi:hypothetical protein POP15_047 [Pectobacterium phage POP15]|nr:hypothetical protein POP15_047 [Pectobacterium phage POP15]
MLEILMADHTKEGYIGQVDSADFISYADLSQLVGYSEGNLNTDVGWLSFMVDGKLVRVAKGAVRYYVTHAAMSALGLVDGKDVVIDGQLWTVRLINGTDGTPFSSEANVKIANSEWNKLFYPIVSSPTGTSPEGIVYGSQAKLSPASIGMAGSGQGRATICRELSSGGLIVNRGFTSVTLIAIRSDAGSVDNGRGWRPILIRK